MLKKAGIVVLGAAAGVLSMSSVAFAGTADGSSDDGGSRHSHSSGHHGDHHGHHNGGGSCDKIAYSEGDSLVNLSNAASNLDLHDVNVLGKSFDQGSGCHGRGGDKAAISSGDSLVNASNLLSNADVSDVNVLGSSFSAE